MLALGAKPAVDRPLKVGLEFIRLFDRHGQIPGEIDVSRAPASFGDVRGYRLCGAHDLISKSASLSREGPCERDGFEGKHVGFLPDLELSEIRHGRNLSASRCKSVIIPLRIEATALPFNGRSEREHEREPEPPAMSNSELELQLQLELELLSAQCWKLQAHARAPAVGSPHAQARAQATDSMIARNYLALGLATKRPSSSLVLQA
jgi:hypothetical protein